MKHVQIKKDSASLLPSSKLLSKFKSVLEEQIEGGYLRGKAFIQVGILGQPYLSKK